MAVALRVPAFVEPLGRDCGEFLYIGQQIHEGALPYVDFWEHKPPGVFYAYALCVALFGYHRVAPHLFATLVHLLTAAVVYRLAVHVMGRRAGIAAAAFFVVSTAAPRFWALGNGQSAETLMALPVTLAVLLAVWATEGSGKPGAGRRQQVWAGLSGLCMALAFWLKATACLPAAVVAALLASAKPARVRLLAAYGVGALCLLVPVPAYFVWRGAGREFFEQAFVHNFEYAGVSVPAGQFAAAAGRALWVSCKFLSALFAFALVGLLWPVARRRPVWLALAGWACLGWAPFFLGGRFYPHYLIEAMAPMAVLAGLGCERVVLASAGRLRRAGGILALAALVAWNGWTYCRSHYRLNLALLFGRMSRAEYLPLIPTGRPEAVGRYLADRLEGDRRILVWGSETAIYPAARARCSSRYLYSYLFVDPQFHSRLQPVAQLMDDLSARPPQCIVIIDTQMPSELFALIRERYKEETRQFRWPIVRRE